MNNQCSRETSHCVLNAIKVRIGIIASVCSTNAGQMSNHFTAATYSYLCVFYKQRQNLDREVKFNVQSRIRTREDEKTQRERESDSENQRRIIGSRWPVTARCLRLVLFSRSPWQLGWRTDSSSLLTRGYTMWAKSLSRPNTHTARI